MSHTPEPWTWMGLETSDNEYLVLGGIGQEFGLIASCTTTEDARRIVACVNACEDVLDYELSRGSVSRLAEQLRTATNQRDELLAAAEIAIPALVFASGHVDNEDFVKVMMARDALNATIANVRGAS